MTNVDFNFTDNTEFSELEQLVRQDMIANGFDPYYIQDIETYWSERLD